MSDVDYDSESLETLSSVSSFDDNPFLLRNRNEVLETLCGMRTHPHVLRAAALLQATARGHLLRQDKHIFDACVAFTHSRARTTLARRRFLRARRASCVLQAAVRGRRVRTSVAGRAIQAYLAARHDVGALETLVLRLTRGVPSVSRSQSP